MAAAWPQQKETEADDRFGDFTRLIAARPAMADDFARVSRHAKRYLDDHEMALFADICASLYHANAGPRVLSAYWQIVMVALPGAPIEPLANIGSSALDICRHAGAKSAARGLDLARSRLLPGARSNQAATLIGALAALASRAPHAVTLVIDSADRLFARLDATGVAGWIEDGLSLYPKDKSRQRRYFTLEDPTALRRLAMQDGPCLFQTHENRLRLLAEALWARPVTTRVQAVGNSSAPRSNIAGGLIFVPEFFPGEPPARAERLFEACIVHAAAHLEHSTVRFAVGKLKPMQIALTALIEDARVDRLAMQAFPGLARLWLPFHDVSASHVQTVQSLFARLSRALVDPDFENSDGWVAKGRSLFETAFAERPNDPMIAREIGNVLGHDLGQLRIPFDAKSYRVEPAYRDDGLGLFDFDDVDPQNEEAIEMMVDAARPQEQDADDGERGDIEAEERARPTVADPSDELGPVLATYAEWDYRLNLDQPDFATVRDYPPRPGPSVRIEQQLDAHARERGRIGALVRSLRLGRPVRHKRLLDGEDIDIEAAQEFFVARAAGETPDPRIHSIRRRQGRDVSLSLLLDISASTADHVEETQRTIIETATLSVALLAEVLQELGDPISIDAFASNGCEDVRLTCIKQFNEPYDQAISSRLAGLIPGYSTRLGTAIRHVGKALANRASHRRVLIVVTDGEPSDIDIDDADYLGHDARHAVLGARSDGLDVFCVALGKNAGNASSAIFGKRNTLDVSRISDLPAQLAGLYFQLTVR